ncbi:hypothetical protein ACMFMF_009745 [Clarireedia jacksonii]
MSFHKSRTFGLLFVLLFYWSIRVISYSKMTSNQSSTIPIQISISDVVTTESETSHSPIVKLKVALRNTSDQPVSFLRWSTPFDPRAVPMGIFEFKSTTSGELATCLNLKLNRKMPESGTYDEEDIEHIDAGGEISKEIEVKAPEVVLSKGEKYVVKAKGSWMHVIFGKKTDIKSDDDRVLRGDFESEGVEVEIE